MVVSFLLVCAVLGSLAAGVLAAYGVCLAMFEAFRVHARQVASLRQASLRQVSLPQVSAEPVLEG